MIIKGFSDQKNIHASYIAVAKRASSRPHHHFRGKKLEVSLVQPEQLGKSEELTDQFPESKEFQNYEQVSCCL